MEESIEKIKTEIFRHMEIDWVPLDGIVYHFMSLQKHEPSQSEFFKALNFIKDLINDKEIICLEGPNMNEVKGDGKEITDWILRLYEEEGYHQIHHGIWFDRKENK